MFVCLRFLMDLFHLCHLLKSKWSLGKELFLELTQEECMNPDLYLYSRDSTLENLQ